MRSLKLTVVIGVVLTMLLLTLRMGNTGPNIARAAMDSEAAPEPRIAVCEAITIVNELMQSDRFAPARAEQEEKLRDELIRPLIDQGKSLEEDLRDADPNSPESNDLKKRLIKLREITLPQAQQQAGVRQEQFVAGQTIDAYSMVVASARDVASELGFNYLFATDASERSLEGMRGAPMAAVQQAILSRPALLFPESVDISDDIRDDLNLE